MGVRSYTLSTTGAPPPEPFCDSMPAAPPVKTSGATDLATCVALASRLVPWSSWIEGKRGIVLLRRSDSIWFDSMRGRERAQLTGEREQLAWYFPSGAGAGVATCSSHCRVGPAKRGAAIPVKSKGCAIGEGTWRIIAMGLKALFLVGRHNRVPGWPWTGVLTCGHEMTTTFLTFHVSCQFGSFGLPQLGSV